MGHFKTFLFGAAAAYGLYLITRKGTDGRSVLDELLEDPADFLHKAKDYAMRDTVKIIKEELN